MKQGVLEMMAGDEIAARLARVTLAGTPGDVEYFRSGVGGSLIKEFRVEQARLALRAPGGVDMVASMESKLTKPQQLSALGEKLFKEVEKQVGTKAAVKSGGALQTKGGAGRGRGGLGFGGGGSRPREGSEARGSNGGRQSFSDNTSCFACNATGHRWFQGVCEEGKKWVKQDPAKAAKRLAEWNQRSSK